MSQNATPEEAAIVIFGASGDLTRRKLIPALHSLACEGLMPKKTRVIGIARSELTDEGFRTELYPGVTDYSRLKPGICDLWPDFSQHLSYLRGDYDRAETYAQLKSHLAKAGSEQCNCLFYLATPPELYPIIIAQLGKAGLNRAASGWRRIIIEKPFGKDLQSACALNREVHSIFEENQIYRIDHYLGKETVQNILTFRFANAIFEPLWNRNYIDSIQITVAENVGVEHRGGYYDHAGVLRDMFQSHLLQLLALIAMEPPTLLDAEQMRDEKVKVLQVVCAPSMEEGVWGQYEDYRREPGVASDSKTPTYVALKLFIDNWRWQGVPFFLRTGKKLECKLSEITLQFKQAPHHLFSATEKLDSNLLALRIQPDEGMHLRFALKTPGAGMKTAPVDMKFSYLERFGERILPEAYERLLLDALQGDASLFARSDEIERSWELITPLLKEWEGQPEPPLKFYRAGSWGPGTVTCRRA